LLKNQFYLFSKTDLTSCNSSLGCTGLSRNLFTGSHDWSISCS